MCKPRHPSRDRQGAGKIKLNSLLLNNEDATLGSPLIRHLLKSEQGICKGVNELRKLLAVLFQCQPEIRQFHRANFFTDGKNIIWEYPGSRLMENKWIL